MVDDIRSAIEGRLGELEQEADKLRQALSALTRGATAATARGAAAAPTAAGRPAAARSRSRVSRPTGTSRAPAAGARSGRSAPGATRSAVLEALATGTAMTAGEIASVTGLGRATISTTLSKLARGGELIKEQRGYRISSSANGASHS